MEMRYFWISDQVARNQFDIKYHPGRENMGDYHTNNQAEYAGLLVGLAAALNLGCRRIKVQVRGRLGQRGFERRRAALVHVHAHPTSFHPCLSH